MQFTNHYTALEKFKYSLFNWYSISGLVCINDGKNQYNILLYYYTQNIYSHNYNDCLCMVVFFIVDMKIILDELKQVFLISN